MGFYRFTLESKERGLRSIIDYLIGRRALKPGVADVKVIRGAEVGSDRHLVLMKVRLKVQRQKRYREAGNCKLMVHKLESKEAKIKFQQEFREVNRQIREADDGGDNVVTMWKRLGRSLDWP